MKENKVIVEFMGVDKCTDAEHIDDPCFYFESQGYIQSCQMEYHKSWEWLMPVIKKIQQLPIAEFSKKKPVMNALMDVEIEPLFLSVIVFIKWYNTIKKV